MSASSEPVVEVPVRLAAHLHARPAGQVVQVAARHAARVEIRHGEKAANARGVLAVLALGAVAGDTVVVRATGTDAQAAAGAVAEVLSAAE
jgi:phosphocarrier protein HPr